MPRRASGEYPRNVTDEEWASCAPYLTLMREDAPQREYPLRDVFNAPRWFVRGDCPWRQLPNDPPPWCVVHQQCQRWLKAGVFELMAADLRALLREVLHQRNPQPSQAIIDSRTVQSTPESGSRPGYDGYKRRKGSKIHAAVGTLGHLLALHVTPAHEQDRDQVGKLAESIQEQTGENVMIVYADQGYTGDRAAEAAAQHGNELCVVKLAQAKRGFVLLPKRWVVERSFAGASRFRRLGRDCERLAKTLAGFHCARLYLPHARSAPKFMTASRDHRLIMEAMLHRLRLGCPWRHLPFCFAALEQCLHTLVPVVPLGALV